MQTDKPSYYYLKTCAICLTIIAAGVATAFLVYTKALLIPLVISIFFYTILAHMTLFLRHKFHFPKWAALTISILLFVAFFTGVVLFTVNAVGSFFKGAEVYRQSLLETSKNVLTVIQDHGISVDQNYVENYLRELPIINWVKAVGGKLLHILSNFTLIVLFMIFFLFGSKKTPPITNPAIKEMLSNVSVYLSVKLMASLITAVVVASVLIGFEVKMALVFALFAFLLNFIPSVGSILAVLLPLPVLFLQFGWRSRFLIVVGLLAGAEFLIGNLLEPRFLGEGLDLHPATVVTSLIFWTLVWGIPGAFLSVPLTASIKIVLSRIKHTHIAAEFMAGRLPH